MAMSLYTVKHCERCGKMFRQYTYEKPSDALLCPYCWALRESKNAEEWQRHYMGKWDCGTMPEPKKEWPKHNPSLGYNKIPGIKNVIFNKPATIILWTDGTKTVVKCKEGDTYDREKGFVMAYMKKILGNDNTFHKVIKQWVKAEDILKDTLHEAGVSFVKGFEDGFKDDNPDIVEAVAKTVEEAASGKLIFDDLTDRLEDDGK